MNARPARTAAEWTTFAVACAVLAVVVALIATQAAGDDAPARPVAMVQGVPRQVGERHFVDVVVSNDGDVTASEVRVDAELTVGGETTSADQTIDFLAGAETADLVFVFEDDPADGQLTVRVSSFAVP